MQFGCGILSELLPTGNPIRLGFKIYTIVSLHKWICSVSERSNKNISHDLHLVKHCNDNFITDILTI